MKCFSCLCSIFKKVEVKPSEVIVEILQNNSKSRAKNLPECYSLNVNEISEDTLEPHKILSLNPFQNNIKCLLCRGQKCKAEDYKSNKFNYIEGLNSNLVGKIVVSQRLSTVLIKKFNLVKTFLNQRIVAVLNLQHPGDHPFCGPNLELESSKFAYFPEELTVFTIDYINYPWVSEDSPCFFDYLIKCAKFVASKTKGNSKRVLIHCHGGKAKSCFLTAFCLLYTNPDLSEKEAIFKVESQRTCFKFESRHLNQLRSLNESNCLKRIKKE